MKWVTFLSVWLLASVCGAQAAPPSGAEPEPAADAAEQAGPRASELVARLSAPTLTVTEARALGQQLFELGRYVDAERAWLAAYGLSPAPELYVAVAGARQAGGDEAGAVAALRAYLELQPEAADRPAIEAQIASLEKAPAKLLIQTDIPGRSVLIDGKPTAQTTPVTLELPPGEHRVVVAGEGQKIGERTVTLTYGEERELSFGAEPVASSEDVRGPEPPEPDAPDEGIRRSVWITSSVAAAALLTGTALGVAALRKDQAYREDPSQKTAERGERLALFADVSFGIAAGAAVTALVLHLTSRKKPDKEVQPTAFRLQIDRRSVGVGTSLEF